jgi:hypothetical protein
MRNLHELAVTEGVSFTACAEESVSGDFVGAPSATSA